MYKKVKSVSCKHRNIEYDMSMKTENRNAQTTHRKRGKQEEYEQLQWIEVDVLIIIQHQQ